MATMFTFTEFIMSTGIYENDHIQRDKGYLGDDMGIMYNETKGLALFCSHDGDDTITIGVSDEDEVWEVYNSLKDVDSKKWEQLLKDAKYETMPGADYFK